MTSHWEGLSAENRKSGKSRSRSFQDDKSLGGMNAENRKSGKSRSRSFQDDKSLGGAERGEQEKRQEQKQVLSG
jgi:hypothetical protein